MEIEPVQDPAYWAERMRKARNPHEAVFLCSAERWAKQIAAHRVALMRYVKPNDFVLDIGCGWGRLIELMPEYWVGAYVGIDISPDFIEKARRTYDMEFVCGDVQQYLSGYEAKSVDLAALISFKPMMLNHAPDKWAGVEKELQRVCKRRLFLEYVEDDQGRLEQ